VLKRVSKLPNYVLVGSDTATMSYRMGLAQTSKQLRAEYLPIYVHKASVSVCSHDMADFLDAFYKPGTVERYGLRNLRICICHSSYPVNFFDVLPLMKIRLANPSIDFHFHANPKCIREDNNDLLVDWQSRCKLAKRFCELDDPAWLAELKSGTFSKIDLLYILQHGIGHVGLELADESFMDTEPDETRLRDALRVLPFSFCRVGSRIYEGPGGEVAIHRHECGL
jgi:hypothetical protein